MKKNLGKVSRIIVLAAVLVLTMMACEEPVTYTITFNANGGSVTPASAATGRDGKLVSLPTPARTGYVFNGWWTQAAGGTEITTDTVFTEDTTVYARWIVSYTITFNANGGSVSPASAATDKDYRLASLPAPTRSGYTFNGWWTSAADGTEITTSTVFTANTTIYAQWIDGYVITFDANGGSVSPTSSATGTDGKLESLPTPVRSGYIFNGWWTETTGGREITTNTVFTEITTVYARWEQGTVVSGDTIPEKLDWMQRNAESHGVYFIDVTSDETIAPSTLSFSGAINITVHLRGVGGNRTIMLASNGTLFTVNANVTFVLGNNITLRGHSQNNGSMVNVNGGAFIMNTGSAITDNNRNGNGGGVYVTTGTFTMNDGTISGNSATNGGGVYLYGGEITIRAGTFTLNGGTISGNNASYGGGVYVGGGLILDNSTFIMNSGTISGNNTSGSGGGVYLGSGYGIRTMNNGTISDNNALHGGGVYNDGATFDMRGGTINGNTATAYGGGVYHRATYTGAFTKTGGTITGYNTTTSGNVVRDSEGVLARRGHAVYVHFSNDSYRKETTAGPNVNLSDWNTDNWDE